MNPRLPNATRFGLAVAGTLAVLLAAGAAGAAAERNFDARAQLELKANVGPGMQQLNAVATFKATLPELAVTFDPASGVTRSMTNRVGYLTGSRPGAEAKAAALDFVSDNLDLLGLAAGDLDGHEIADSVYSSASGATHLYLRQTHLGLPVYNGLLQVNVNREGRILGVNNAFVPGIANAVDSSRPALSAEAAVASAAKHLGLDRGVETSSEARLMWLPVGRGARLVWNFQLETPDRQHYYDFTVDAASGKVWTRFDWVTSADYRVYELPVESPNHTSPTPPADGRTLQINPDDATASPFGWHDTNGAAGAEFTIMRGNNVHAYEDSDGNNAPPASQPDCGGSLSCDFPIDLTQAPSAYRPAAIANLFYWNNVIHDVQYQYGFDEAAGNFQVNNYGNGGAGGDDVRAEAQDGAGNCNANFFTPTDGSRPRMQMFTCNNTNPAADGDLDNGVIVHEYGHGISIRQVGGPNNSSCLGNRQQPGEGWSDWLALAYTAETGDAGTDARGIGTYLFGQPANGPGIRPAPYSTDFGVNDFLFSDIRNVSVPHGVGFVWATAVWEVYWELVNHHGFSADLYNAGGGSGNQRAMLYVNEGLKNTACSPTFIDARDGVVQAATDNHAGEDVCRVWTGFARRGLGVDASTGGSNSLRATDGFDVPPECGGGQCAEEGASCTEDPDCCSGNCSGGKPSTRVCLP